MKNEPGGGARQNFYCVDLPLYCGCDDRHHDHGRCRQGCCLLRSVQTCSTAPVLLICISWSFAYFSHQCWSNYWTFYLHTHMLVDKTPDICTGMTSIKKATWTNWITSSFAFSIKVLLIISRKSPNSIYFNASIRCRGFVHFKYKTWKQLSSKLSWHWEKNICIFLFSSTQKKFH